MGPYQPPSLPSLRLHKPPDKIAIPHHVHDGRKTRRQQGAEEKGRKKGGDSSNLGGEEKKGDFPPTWISAAWDYPACLALINFYDLLVIAPPNWKKNPTIPRGPTTTRWRASISHSLGSSDTSVWADAG